MHLEALTLRARRIGCAENLAQIVQPSRLIPHLAELLIRETGRIARALPRGAFPLSFAGAYYRTVTEIRLRRPIVASKPLI